jgi:hypothetical protein
MFKRNPEGKQISLIEPYLYYPQYVREALYNSWAAPFSETIVPNNAESRFASLYSDNYSRPNAPVNILVGLLILKELNGHPAPEDKLGADHTRLGTPEHQALADFRGGVEGVPSVLRCMYSIDELPVRGLIRARIWDGLKDMAYNLRSYYSYLKRNRARALSFSYYIHLISHFFRFKVAAV